MIKKIHFPQPLSITQYSLFLFVFPFSFCIWNSFILVIILSLAGTFVKSSFSPNFLITKFFSLYFLFFHSSDIMLYNFKGWQNGRIGIFYCLHPYPSITSILTILHGWEGVQHKSSNTPLEKKKRKLGILKRIRSTVSLDPDDLYPKAPQVNGKSLVSASDFSRRGRWGQVNKHVCQRGSLVYWVPPPLKYIEERCISKDTGTSCESSSQGDEGIHRGDGPASHLECASSPHTLAS